MARWARLHSAPKVRNGVIRVTLAVGRLLAVCPDQQAGAPTPRDDSCCKLIRPSGKICSIFLTIASDTGFFVAKSRARKLKFVEAIQSGLGCRFATHKYFSFRKSEIVFSSHRPAPARGAYASSRTRGGMRWTQAVSLDERCCARTAKACGPGAPTLALRSRVSPADDGGKRARSPGRARYKLLKPLRGECRMYPVPPL
jgi:hypothetical protein